MKVRQRDIGKPHGKMTYRQVELIDMAEKACTTASHVLHFTFPHASISSRSNASIAREDELVGKEQRVG